MEDKKKQIFESELEKCWNTLCIRDEFWNRLKLIKSIYQSLDRENPRIILLAKSKDTSESYAVKVVYSETPTLNEVENIPKTYNPRILNFFKVEKIDNFWFLCFRYLPFGDAVEIMSKGKLSEERAKRIFVQVVEAVQFIHSQNIAHRDIKLDNLLVGNNDEVVLGDFEFCEKSGPNHISNSSAGTFLYSSPEMRFSKPSGFQSDIWALGVTLFVLVFGKFPFSVSCLRERKEVIYLERAFLKEPSVSKSCKDLIRKILSLNGNERPTASKILHHPWCRS